MNGNAAGSPARVFGAMLGHYRARAGLTLDQVGARVHFSGSLIHKIEGGKRTPTEALAKACDDALGAGGALTELHAQLRDSFGDRPYPAWFGKWPDAEAQARTLRWFEPLVIPGLMQTEDYARAILSTRVGDTPDEITEMVDARLERQSILAREKPPTLWVIMDEGVLRRGVGGPEVMRPQLVQLREMAARPDIVVQVIPLSTGGHQGLNGGAFILADMPDGVRMAYQDTASRGQVIEDGDDLEALSVTWSTLQADALPRTATLSLLKEVESTWNG